jgi:hypothetical protein
LEQAKWRNNSSSLRTQAGITVGHSPWTQRQGIELRGVPRLDRNIDMIDYRWAMRTKKKPKTDTATLKNNAWVNLLQQQSRHDAMNPGCLTSGALYYSYDRDCLLDGEDFMRLQGAPEGSGGAASNRQLYNLGGEAFHAPSIAAAVYSYYLNGEAPWYALHWRMQNTTRSAASSGSV